MGEESTGGCGAALEGWRVGEHGGDLGGERLRVGGGMETDRAVIQAGGENLAQHRQIGGDDGQARHAGFDTRQAEGLPDGWKKIEIGGRHQLAQARAIYTADEMQATGDIQFQCLLQHGAIGAVAGNDQMRLGQMGQSGDGDGVALLGGQAAGGQEERRGWRDREGMAPVASV